ncbi:unnamed protein product [Fusarium venenatum]|uniref:Uncharacterized protein n=1 Tax=Fusarium venenatum TaxID=56646 RepID=A0A2L2T9D5_9HYPO|nr:uncharacterized protein FVRRES_13499 [Fusarium venenatum]CEI41268.1 unnamed protein product [Fusarium venenatum]
MAETATRSKLPDACARSSSSSSSSTKGPPEASADRNFGPGQLFINSYRIWTYLSNLWPKPLGPNPTILPSIVR